MNSLENFLFSLQNMSSDPWSSFVMTCFTHWNGIRFELLLHFVKGCLESSQTNSGTSTLVLVEVIYKAFNVFFLCSWHIQRNQHISEVLSCCISRSKLIDVAEELLTGFTSFCQDLHDIIHQLFLLVEASHAGSFKFSFKFSKLNPAVSIQVDCFDDHVNIFRGESTLILII